jgi:transcriptional regulator with XRE-family HTH domain
VKILGMQPVQKALGARIRELRLKKGWSQEEFADNCGIHRSHMGEIERGETNLTLSTLLVISKQLEVSISALFKGIA